MPTIQKYMTTTPLTVGHDQPLVSAERLMEQIHARHLPVLDGGKLVGVITERDIAMARSLAGEDAWTLKVEDAMVQNPFTVAPETPLDEVAKEMAEKRYGSAVIVQNNRVVGIFTVVDALATLAELLQRPARARVA